MNDSRRYEVQTPDGNHWFASLQEAADMCGVILYTGKTPKLLDTKTNRFIFLGGVVK